MKLKKILPYPIAALIAAFGLMTLFMSGSVIFDLFDIRAKEGNYVQFVVISNFICSFIYLIAAFGFIKNKVWTTKILIIAIVVLLLAFIGLIIHINSGGVYETKTVGAMIFRICFTLTFIVISYFLQKKFRIEK